MYYLDTSVVLSLFLNEPVTNRVLRWLDPVSPEDQHTSRWTDVEIVSVLGRRVRRGEMNKKEAEIALQDFASWRSRNPAVLDPTSADFVTAAGYSRNFEPSLGAADALHLAIAHNHGRLQLITLDSKLASAALRLQLPAHKP